MSDLAKADKFGLTPTIDPEFKRGVTKALALLHSNLKTYGKQPDSDLRDGWILHLLDKRILAREIGPAVRHFLGGTEMPSVGQFAAWILSDRQEKKMAASLRRGVEQAEQERHQAFLTRMAEHHGTTDPPLDDVLARVRQRVGTDNLMELPAKRMPKSRSLSSIDEDRKAQILAELDSRNLQPGRRRHVDDAAA